MSGKLRYLLSIVLITYLISTVSDFLVLIDSLGMFDVFGYADNWAIVVMTIFTSVALLAYSIWRSRS